MGLSADLLSQFAKVTNDRTQVKKETVAYGTIVEWNDGLYVQLDGSDICTPYDTTTAVEPGDRVAVQLKNHTATITGNMSSPAVKIGKVEDINGEVSVYIYGIEAEEAVIVNLDATYARIKDLDATNATIKNLTADEAFIKSLDSMYANIDFANIGVADIDELFAKYGMIEVIEGVDGTFTRNLVGVNIVGDTIQANNLVVKGENGIFYKLNIDTTGGVLPEEVSEEDIKNGLLGTVIVAKSITADKISVTDLSAFGATIGGFKITDKAIHSVAKDSPNNTTRGIYLDNEGQFAIGDTNQFIKYYKQADGTYKFEILADSIKLKAASGNSAIASEAYVNDTVDGIDIGGRNYLVNTTNSWSDDITVVGWQYYLNQNDFITVSSDAFEDLINKTVTFSGYIRNNSGAEVGIMMHVMSPDVADGYRQITSTMKVTAGNTGFVEHTFTMPDAIQTITGIRFAVRHSAKDVEDSVVNIKGWKLEVGNKATAWSPAPEDMYTKEQADAAIKVAADAITSEVSSTYATKSALKEAESAIEQTANSISSSVKAKFDALVIGGRNLALGSEDDISFTNKVQIFNLSAYGAENVKNTNVTISFDACTDEPGIGVDYYLRYIDPATNGGKAVGRVIINSLTDTYQRYSATINTAEAGDNDVTMFAIRNTKNSTVSTSSDTATVYVKNIKVEIGDKATDWTPAPEDVAVDVESANSLALQLSNSFNNLVSSDKGGSFFQQDDQGNWYFTSAETAAEMAKISSALSALESASKEDLAAIQKELDALKELSNYIRLETGGEHPSIELGENDSPYRTVITNTDIKYYDGSRVLATFDTNGLTADNVTVNKELNVAGLVIRKKSNGYVGMGLF